MPEVRIHVPRALTEEAVLAFSVEMQSVPMGESYVVDLSRLRHVEPFGMLMGASILRRFISARKDAGGKFVAAGFTDNSYAAHMGLYRAFGLPYGRRPGEASGSNRYIPITCLSIQEIQTAAGYNPVGIAVEGEAKRLARVLLQKTDGSRFSHIAYALLEMMRNVVEHSFATEIWCAAQCWPRKNCVEVAILDEGVGVRASLGRNLKIRPRSDEDALRLALQAGVSGVPEKSEELMLRDAYADEWTNAGLGLFVVSQLCAEGGAFSITSGTTCLSLTASGTSVTPAAFSGTGIRLKLDAVSDRDINAFIDRIVPEGIGRHRSHLWPEENH